MTFADLSPRMQRWLTLGGVGSGVLLVSWGSPRGFPAAPARVSVMRSTRRSSPTPTPGRPRSTGSLPSSTFRDRNAELAKQVEALSERQRTLPDDLAERLQRSLLSDWQQAYLANASAVGSSWLDFMGERLHAYAHAIDDISHCHDLNKAWRFQATLSQGSVNAYSEQAAKFGSMLKAVNANAEDRSN